VLLFALVCNKTVSCKYITKRTACTETLTLNVNTDSYVTVSTLSSCWVFSEISLMYQQVYCTMCILTAYFCYVYRL